jgi:hypothetical protein
MTAPRFNGKAAGYLKEEAERLRRFFQATNGGQLKLNPDLIEIAISDEHFFRYPDGKFRDGRGNELDPATLIIIPPPAEEPAVDLEEWDFGGAGIIPSELPPRGWLLGSWMCRQFVSSLFGDGAVGKTANRIACALALATGRSDILKSQHVFQRARVMFLCFEDGEIELQRRVCAAMLHYGISNADIAGYLYVKAITNSELKLAVSDDYGNTTAGPLLKAIETSITRPPARCLDL